MDQDKKITCEWCQVEPKLCFEAKKKKRTILVGTAMFYYSCFKHRGKLEELAKSKHGEVIDIRQKKIQKGY